MKLLIVDDEKSIRNTLKDILEFEGHEVILASDGVEGFALASANSFDAIFSDIKMPNMDGVEFLDKLTESGIDTAVIMISGHGSIDTAVDCIKKGAFDFIQKPLDLNRILITLKNATDKTSLVKETKILKRKFAKIPEIAAAVINHHAGWERKEIIPSEPHRGYMENFAHLLNIPGIEGVDLVPLHKLFNIF